ncbi:hypothetical protein M8J75_004042 [Diaphorina citri]|nr:hypothetical protein M8J75_004042 [Diaphorina citri]
MVFSRPGSYGGGTQSVQHVDKIGAHEELGHKEIHDIKHVEEIKGGGYDSHSLRREGNYDSGFARGTLDLNRHDGRVGGFDGRVSGHDVGHVGLHESRVGGYEGRVGGFDGRVGGYEGRVGGDRLIGGHDDKLIGGHDGHHTAGLYDNDRLRGSRDRHDSEERYRDRQRGGSYGGSLSGGSHGVSLSGGSHGVGGSYGGSSPSGSSYSGGRKY